jgi:hypothetical protein
MSVCTNLGLDRSSRLAACAGYVVLCRPIPSLYSRAAPPRLRATHTPTPLSSSPSPNKYVCQVSARSAQPFGRLYRTGQHSTYSNRTEAMCLSEITQLVFLLFLLRPPHSRVDHIHANYSARRPILCTFCTLLSLLYPIDRKLILTPGF